MWRVLGLGCVLALVACGRDGGDAAAREMDAGPEQAMGDGDGTKADAATNGPADGSLDASADAAAPTTSCGDVPLTGRCVDADTVEVCIQPTGAAAPHATSYDCAAGESCQEGANGAECVLTADCLEGTTRCGDASTLEQCTSGSYVPSACARGCVESALGAFCAADLDTQTWTGKVTYDTHLPNDTFTDWSSTVTEAPAQGFLVLAYHGDALVDAVVTSEAMGTEGSFSIRVPSVLGADDSLVVVAAGTNSQQELAYAVVDAGYAASSKLRSTFDAAPNPRLWSWSSALAGATNGDTIHITEADGSGAARVFDYLHIVYEFGDAYYQPQDPQTVIVWLGMGTAWDCGACMAPLPVNALDFAFAHQVWLDGSTDQGYWSDPVTAHELGHYVMAAFGFATGEGGPHYIGVPTNPGQAWGEGWATFFSALVRDTSVYYDKQAGAFFWLDLDMRAYADANVPWQRPQAQLGLTQLMDENELSALLWGTYQSLGKGDAMLDAIASPRMTHTPFARGYTRRTWSDPDHPESYADTGESHPFVADFFDALRCKNAISKAALDLVTEPAVHYPYPAGSPLCP